MAEGNTRTRCAGASRRSALVLLVALALPVWAFADSASETAGGAATCREAPAAPALFEIEQRVRRALREAQRGATPPGGPVVLNGRGYNYRASREGPPDGFSGPIKRP
jgi:hypothetical protein